MFVLMFNLQIVLIRCFTRRAMRPANSVCRHRTCSNCWRSIAGRSGKNTLEERAIRTSFRWEEHSRT